MLSLGQALMGHLSWLTVLVPLLTAVVAYGSKTLIYRWALRDAKPKDRPAILEALGSKRAGRLSARRRRTPDDMN